MLLKGGYAFNKCSQDSFLSHCRSDLPEMFSWVQWSYCCIGELCFGPHWIASSTGVQQGDPLGPLLFSLVLIDFLSSVTFPAGLAFQLWCLDDGTLVGMRSGLASFCKYLYGMVQVLVSTLIYLNVRSFGLLVISCFQSFPLSVTHISLLQEEGAAFLGSPVWGSSDYFLSFVGKAVNKVASLQDCLEGLGNPQVELHLLQSCLGVCKLNHLLRTISPNCAISQLEVFNYNLRSALGCICKSSISDLAWLQATLLCSMGGLGLRETTSTSSAALLGSCFSSQELCSHLIRSFSGGPDMFPFIPDQDVATSILLPWINSDFFPDLIQPACGQHVFQHELDIAHQTLLLNSLTIRDQARIRTSSWLRAIPCDSLGLSMSSQEFVCSLQYWLGVPLFSATSLVGSPG